MSDETHNDQDNDPEESFAELFEAYSAGMNEDISVGDKIEAKIVSIGSDSVFVDTGTKLDGIVEKEELLEENGELKVAVGDTLALYVVSKDESEIRLSKALTGIESSHLLLDAYKNKVPVEGKVAATCKGGFNVELMKKRAFCPISQMDIKFVNEPDDYVGNTYPFLIKTYEERGRNIVVSRRDLLEKELEKGRAEFLSSLTPGSHHEGEVTKLMPFGAFIELCPGLEGMAHISELSWSRVEKPEEILKTGDKVMVKVIGVDGTGKGKRPKISLSLKQVSGDPWETTIKKFRSGDKVTGRVTRCAPFGAFVEIAPGLEGLVHISEMSYTKRVLKPEDVVAVGETVSVMVKEVDLKKRRISLSLKDAEGDPWLDVAEKYKVGSTISGTLEKKEGYGYFVALEPGITGLFPKSKINESIDPASIEKLKPGDSLTVIVEDVQLAERRITLGPSDRTDSTEWKQFAKKEDKPLGALAEKLQQALSAKTPGPD